MHFSWIHFSLSTAFVSIMEKKNAWQIMRNGSSQKECRLCILPVRIDFYNWHDLLNVKIRTWLKASEYILNTLCIWTTIHLSKDYYYLDGRVLRPIIKPRPSFGYFSTVILVKFGFANSTKGANFRPFLCMVMSYRPTDYILIKRVFKIS